MRIIKTLLAAAVLTASMISLSQANNVWVDLGMKGPCEARKIYEKPKERWYRFDCPYSKTKPLYADVKSKNLPEGLKCRRTWETPAAHAVDFSYTTNKRWVSMSIVKCWGEIKNDKFVK